MTFDSSMPPAALFDLDGVIIDTERQYTLFWDMIGRQYLHHPDFGKLIKGGTLVHIFEEFFSELKDKQNEISAALDDFEAKMEVPYINGFKDFFQSLKKAGWKTAVVTSSSAGKMKSLYKKIPEIQTMFDKILTAEMFSKSKPDPDPYMLGAEIFNLPRTNCLVFEDSVNGFKSAKSAGMKLVGLTTTNPENIVSRYADLIINDFYEISAEKALEILKN